MRAISDLGEESERALEHRRLEIPAVDAIANAESLAFITAQKEARAHPVISRLRQQAEEIRGLELEKALQDMNHVDEAVRTRVIRLSQTIVNKLLHGPTARLRAAAENGAWEEHERVIRNLFALARDDGNEQ